MSLEEATLRKKLADVLAWERRKRWEGIGCTILCGALALAIVLAPLHSFLPAGARWLVPLVLFGALAPIWFYRQRWTRRDATRALTRLDDCLGLDERAVTAWELSERNEQSGVAQLVFKQAREKLRSVDLRRLLPRRWSWPALAALPLFILWFALLWLDWDRWTWERPRALGPRSLAHQARQYSRELQEKAKLEGLGDTLQMGREIEKVAQQSIDKRAADESLKKELAGVSQKFDPAAKAGAADSFAAASQQSLKDLKAELEAAREFNPPVDPAKALGEQERRWLERLAALPQLRRQLDQRQQAGQSPGPGQLKSFLNQLDQQVTGELDRRALIDAQQYLQQMMRQGDGERQGDYARSGGQSDEESSADAAKEKARSNLPGKEPGKKTEEARGLPQFRADASTQIKGSLGAGESSALNLKGKPTPGKTAVPRQEVVASYRRQAEQELNSERVPAELKETIKNYFLSLGANPTNQ